MKKRTDLLVTNRTLGKAGVRDMAINNEVTELVMKGFKQRHLDLAILTFIESQSHEVDEFIIEGSRIRKLLYGNAKMPIESFKQQLFADCDILLHLESRSIGDDFDIFNIYERFRYYKGTDTLHVRFSRSGWELLIEGKQFLLASLNDYLKVSGFYARNLFMLLKRYRVQQKFSEVFPRGGIYLSWATFRKLIKVPDTYTNSDVKKRALFPALRQFREQGIFKNIELSFIKDRSKRGSPVSHISITFDPEPQNACVGGAVQLNLPLNKYDDQLEKKYAKIKINDRTLLDLENKKIKKGRLTMKEEEVRIKAQLWNIKLKEEIEVLRSTRPV